MTWAFGIMIWGGHRYLRYKSFQRFTETYALLERAEQRGLFAAGAFTPPQSGRPLRVASIGGGYASSAATAATAATATTVV